MIAFKFNVSKSIIFVSGLCQMLVFLKISFRTQNLKCFEELSIIHCVRKVVSSCIFYIGALQLLVAVKARLWSE